METHAQQSSITTTSSKYCGYHKQNASKKYTSTRTELKGGTGFRDYLKSEGIYVVKPTDDKRNLRKSTQPKKLLSVEDLKKALSKADKVTTNIHSQGIRFGTKQEPPVAKKMKMDQRRAPEQKAKEVGVKMIELDFASSDEELCG